MLTLSLEDDLKEIASSWNQETFTAKILYILRKTPNILIFGAGNNGRKIAEIATQAGFLPVAFIDQTPSKIGTTIENLPVFNEQMALEKYKHNATIIVSPYSVQHSYRRSKAKFESLGWNVVSFIEVGIALSNTFIPFYFIDRPNKIKQNISDICNLYDHIIDEASKAELMAQLKFRLTLNFDNLPKPTEYFSYLRGILPNLCHFIDGGAFDGDTIRAFLRLAGNNFADINAFEPDPINFGKLTQYHQSLAAHLQNKISLHQAGLWLERKTLRFIASGAANSQFVEDDTGDTPVLPVDDLEFYNCVILKLDVEGAEAQAILGAKNLFKRGLAIGVISVYHKVTDLWEIPKLILSINSGYMFGLQSHADDGIDLTLYAIPVSLIRR